MLKVLFIALVLVHAFIHLIGFVKAFQFADFDTLVRPVTKKTGLLWLLSTLLFLLTLGLFLKDSQYWWATGLIAIILSEWLIICNWQNTRWGTLLNLILLLPIVSALADSLPSGYKNRYHAEVEKRLMNTAPDSILSYEDVAALPLPVRRYLYFAHVVGKKRVSSFSASFTGAMCNSPEGIWTPIKAEQYNFFTDMSRIFYIRSHIYGIPFDGLHLYSDRQASMQIKVASLIPVVNARGAKMLQSETVTLFNDMCLLAPATLISKQVKWGKSDSFMAQASFTNAGNTIQATLYFNGAGALTDFSSEDRYLSADGKHYDAHRWSTPVKSYQLLNGRNVPAHIEAVWHLPGKTFTYARFDLLKMDYNVTNKKR